MKNKLLFLSLILGALSMANHSFANGYKIYKADQTNTDSEESDTVDKNYDYSQDSDPSYDSQVYLGISSGYSMGKSKILNQETNATIAGVDLNNNSFSGDLDVHDEITVKPRKDFFAMEGGYNFNKYFGLGVEFSVSSIYVSEAITSSFADQRAYQTTTTARHIDWPDSLPVYSYLAKATGYFPINNEFALYGDLGLGITVVSQDGNEYTYDFLKDYLETGTFGAGIKITPVSHMYLKIGFNMIVMNNIIDTKKSEKSVLNGSKDRLLDNTKYLRGNINVKSSDPKNIYINEIKATIGYQF